VEETNGDVCKSVEKLKHNASWIQFMRENPDFVAVQKLDTSFVRYLTEFPLRLPPDGARLGWKTQE
jgi:hypothetical protein